MCIFFFFKQMTAYEVRICDWSSDVCSSDLSPSRIKVIFGNSAMIEGWAVYSERMMLESGWPGGADAHQPEMELMYSKWALRVVCNTILDYGVHVLGMSQAEIGRAHV